MNYEKLLEQQNEELKQKLAVTEQQLLFTRLHLKYKLQFEYTIFLEADDATDGDYLQTSACVDRDVFGMAYCLMRTCENWSHMKTIIHIHTPLQYKINPKHRYIFSLSFMISTRERDSLSSFMFTKKYTTHNSDEFPVSRKTEYDAEKAISAWALKV